MTDPSADIDDFGTEPFPLLGALGQYPYAYPLDEPEPDEKDC